MHDVIRIVESVTATKEKQCPHCRETKPTTEFYENRSKGGFQAYCKECLKANSRAQRKTQFAYIAELEDANAALENRARDAEVRADALQKILNDLFHKSTS